MDPALGLLILVGMEVSNAGLLPLTGPDGGESLQSGRDVGVEGTASWEERERGTGRGQEKEREGEEE